MAKRRPDPIPETFGSLEEAGAFWDTHSLSDYRGDTKAVDMEFAITKRIRYVSIPEEVYRKISARAHERKQTVRDLVSALAR
jgi:hypothetical protein